MDFIFKDNKVSFKNEEGYEINIGTLDNYNNKWRWTNTEPEDIIDFVRDMKFDAKESAAIFLKALIDRSEAYRKNHPIPTDLGEYLESKARKLREKRQALLNEFWDIRRDHYVLNQLAERHGLERVTWFADSDKEESVRKLLEFKIYVNDDGEEVEVPFLSETALYNLVGKEDARSILSLMKKLCEQIAPDMSITL